ncbi:hypothetical protein OKW27_000155 [Paraburkholderia sp. 35.1]
MIVERVWTGNAYRNFNYLIACPETVAGSFAQTSGRQPCRPKQSLAIRELLA